MTKNTTTQSTAEAGNISATEIYMEFLDNMRDGKIIEIEKD